MEFRENGFMESYAVPFVRGDFAFVLHDRCSPDRGQVHVHADNARSASLPPPFHGLWKTAKAVSETAGDFAHRCCISVLAAQFQSSSPGFGFTIFACGFPRSSSPLRMLLGNLLPVLIFKYWNNYPMGHMQRS